MNTRRAEPGLGFYFTAALVFVTSTAGTVLWCGAMAPMPGMQMPGGWVMSMAWMRMPGQGWTEAGVSFIGMWTLMMVAMMLPVAMPMLARYRRAMSAEPRVDLLTLAVAAGYFCVWTGVGVALYPVGVAFAELAMRIPEISRWVPMAAGLSVAAAGALQFSEWKARQLACCAGMPARLRVPAGYATAWRYGLMMGLRCNYCCAGLTAILLVMGVMDLWAMAVVMTAISAERLLPASRSVSRAFGVVAVVTGLLMMARAWLG